MHTWEFDVYYPPQKIHSSRLHMETYLKGEELTFPLAVCPPAASFTDEQHLWFLEFYKKLCVLGLQHENGHSENQAYPLELESKYALVRRNCAYNFPVSDPDPERQLRGGRRAHAHKHTREMIIVISH